MIKGYLENVEAKIEQLEKTICAGQCVDFVAYKSLVSEVKGLRKSLSILDDTLEELKKDGE